MQSCWPGWRVAQGWPPTPAPPIFSSPPSLLLAFGSLDSGAGCTLGGAEQLRGGGTGNLRRDTPETCHSTFHLLSHLVGAEPLVVGFSPAGVVLPLSPTLLPFTPTLQSPIWTAVAHHLTSNLTHTLEVARRMQTEADGGVTLVPAAEFSARLSAAVADAAGAAETAGHLLPPTKREGGLVGGGLRGCADPPNLCCSQLAATIQGRGGDCRGYQSSASHDQVSIFGLFFCWWATIFPSQNIMMYRAHFLPCKKIFTSRAQRREDVKSMRAIKTSPGRQ